MKPLGLISQIIAIGTSVAIVFLFVQPTFIDTGLLQNEIQQYAQERERVTETNATLASRVSELEAVSVADRTRLITYMPTFLDEVAVLRDLEIIAELAGVNYTTIKYNGESVDNSEKARMLTESNGATAHEFDVAIEGTYARVKDFLSLLEQNQYPLQVQVLTMGALEGGFLQVEATLATYVNTPAEVITR
jgi:hypothetical protein